MVGPETRDDAGVYLVDGLALVATADFITPVCDDARIYGRIAAANSISDVYAMGGRPLFALNLCCFPDRGIPDGVLEDVLLGATDAASDAGAVILGGHSVRDNELKFGLAVIGKADPDRLLTNRDARPGDALVLTKRLGTGILINAFKLDKTGLEVLEPALDEMSRLNDTASRLALEHGSRTATDVTGFGLAGHAAGMAKASKVRIELDSATLPMHDGYVELVERGVTTGATTCNEDNVRDLLEERTALEPARRSLLFDPQTSGGLLIAVEPSRASDLVEELIATGHHAAAIGRVTEGPPGLVIV